MVEQFLAQIDNLVDHFEHINTYKNNTLFTCKQY